MAFKFNPDSWYRARAKKPFAGICVIGIPDIQAGAAIYYRVNKSMREHWTVFDGGRHCAVLDLPNMKEFVESVRNGQGVPDEVSESEGLELNYKLEKWVRGS
jgi:hypothetical protein